MKPVRKLLLAGVGGVVLVAAAGYFVTTRYLAELMAKEIEAQTGLHASIRSAELDLWPHIRITADGLKLADPDGAPLLSVDKTAFGLSFHALLQRKVHLTGLSLTHPVLKIVDKANAAAAPAHTPGKLSGISFTGPIKISNGVFIDDNQRRHVTTKIDKIALLAQRHPDGSLALNLFGDIEGFGLGIDGKIASAADFIAGRTTTFNGNVATGQNAQPHAVQTQLRLKSPELSFDDLHASWTQGTQKDSLTAAGAFRWDGEAPKFTAHVNADTIDLGLSNLKDLDKAQGNAFDQLSDHTTDFSELRALDAAIDINAQDVTAGGLHFGQTTVATTLDDGRAKIAVAAPNFYRGKASVDVVFDASKPTPMQALKVNVEKIDSIFLFKDLTGTNNVGGFLGMSADLSSSGASPRMIARNLAGIANLQFTQGVVTGLNLPEMFKTVSQYLPKAWQDLNNQITINSLTADFQLAAGQAATNDLHIVSPVLDVTGKGTIDLANREFNLRFDPKVVRANNSDANKTISPLDLGAAILVRGPWSDPQISADLSSLMQNPQATINKLQDLGQQLLGDKSGNGSGNGNGGNGSIMKGLGDLLQGLGGGGK